MTTPYTYRVKHRPSGRWYHGVRYAHDCHPSDLWVTYFTSSTTVLELLNRDGAEAFAVEVRKTFPSKEAAIRWEHRVNTRIIKYSTTMNACAWPAVSPAANARAQQTRATIGDDGMTPAQRAGAGWKMKKHQIDPITGLTYGQLRRKRFNETLDKNGTRQTLSEHTKKRLADNNPVKLPGVKAKIAATLKRGVADGSIGTTKGTKQPKISELLKGNKFSAGLVWFNDGSTDYRLHPSDPRAQSLRPGRLFSAIRGQKYAAVQCPHCGKSGAGGNMKRYHFDACPAKRE